MPVIERLTVVGVGLIGGSLALAARAAGLVGEIVGCGRGRANLEVALARGIVDRITTDPAEAVHDAEVVLLATPVGSCAPVAAALAAHVRPETLLTDVASVKAPVVEALEAVWPSPAHVVGAHPIAGSERAGAAAARPDLFVSRRCILTPTAATSQAAVARVERLWQGVGAHVESMEAGRHDEIMAWVSHLPHAVASALVETIGRGDAAGVLLGYAGSGFDDTTRIAAGSPELWRDILLANRAAVLASLDAFRRVLDELAGSLAAGDAGAIEGLLAEARAHLRRGDDT